MSNIASLKTDTTSATQQDIDTARYYLERASYYERVYHKPERQTDLRSIEAYVSHVPSGRLSTWLDVMHARLEPGAKVVMLDNSFVQTSNLPISRKDDEGNTSQIRTLDDGSTYEVVKNFPTKVQARQTLGNRACNMRWLQFEHYWLLEYTVT